MDLHILRTLQKLTGDQKFYTMHEYWLDGGPIVENCAMREQRLTRGAQIKAAMTDDRRIAIEAANRQEITNSNQETQGRKRQD